MVSGLNVKVFSCTHIRLKSSLQWLQHYLGTFTDLCTTLPLWQRTPGTSGLFEVSRGVFVVCNGWFSSQTIHRDWRYADAATKF